ncbi:hypothetical protein MUB16_22900 [Priestia sp. OVL9]|nr:hypothetical protein [Priestia sp. OVL9]
MKKMDELFKDLDVYRTQEEMKQYFEHTQQMIHQNREYIKLARLKKGRFKKFLKSFIRFIASANLPIVRGIQN